MDFMYSEDNSKIENDEILEEREDLEGNEDEEQVEFEAEEGDLLRESFRKREQDFYAGLDEDDEQGDDDLDKDFPVEIRQSQPEE